MKNDKITDLTDLTKKGLSDASFDEKNKNFKGIISDRKWDDVEGKAWLNNEHCKEEWTPEELLKFVIEEARSLHSDKDLEVFISCGPVYTCDRPPAPWHGYRKRQSQ